MTKRIDTIAVVCCLITGLFCAVQISSDLEDGRECKIDLDRERALRLQAEDIKMKLIESSADEWCRDSVNNAYEALEACESTGDLNVYPSECGECWNSWTMDMAGSCQTLLGQRRNTLEDTMFMRSTMIIWEDYVDARISDCESRNLKTREEREKCLGPAAQSEEVLHAFEAMSIHQESKAF